MSDIKFDLIDANLRGLSPPQDWTTRAIDEITRLRDEMEKYKDCLKFYATSSNYSFYATEPDYPHTEYTCLIMLDKGKMAKRALEAK